MYRKIINELTKVFEINEGNYCQTIVMLMKERLSNL